MFRLSFSGFTGADGWACTFILVGSQRIELTGTADGNDFTFLASATTTQALTAGRGAYHVKMTKGGEVKTVGSGWTKIKNSLSALESLPTVVDPAAMVRKIDEAIRGALDTGFSSFSIGGQSATTHSLSELRIMRDYYSVLARQKQARERGKSTGTWGKPIQVRVS